MKPAASVPEELARFDVPSVPGNERMAIERVSAAVAAEGLSVDQLERLRTAVAEATMNGIEHGNGAKAETPVEVVVVREPAQVVVTVTDMGGGRPPGPAETPDLEAKLAGLQRPRGWGLFLIEHMVDEVDDMIDGERHTVRLVLRRAPADAADTADGPTQGRR